MTPIRRKLVALLVWGWAASSWGASAKTGHKPWGEWIANGNGCRNDTVETVQNGDTLSVIFSSFGILMPEGEAGDGLDEKRRCHFRIKLQAPAGMELAGVTQVYSGGLIKSAGSRGRLVLKYHVGEVEGKELPLVWAQNQVVRPEDPGSVFVYSSETAFDPQGCAKRSVYHAKLLLHGQRQSTAAYLIGGIDTLDMEFRHRVKVKVRWKPCRS